MVIPPLNLSLDKKTSVGPSSSDSAGMFDSSGWNVNYGGTQTNETTRTGPQQTGTPESIAGAVALAGPWLWIAGALLVGVVIYKKLG